MAQRRMFSLKIVSSDAFLEMPTSSRELYFQLGMYADDDGFVNPKKIMRMIGASDDDLKVLLTKRFLLSFENGVVVVKHWLINNLVRKDFYQETIYLEEKKLLFTKDNKSYTDDCKQIVNNLDTQVRLGKDRIDNITPLIVGDEKKNYKLIPLKENYMLPPWNEELGEREKRPEKKVNALISMKELISWAENRRGGSFMNIKKQFKAMAMLRESKISIQRTKDRYCELERDEFWKKKGFDFMDVANSFDKRP